MELGKGGKKSRNCNVSWNSLGERDRWLDSFISQMNAVRWPPWRATAWETGMSEAVDEKCAHFALRVVNTGPKSDELQPPGDWILSMPNCPSSPTTPQVAAAPPALQDPERCGDSHLFGKKVGFLPGERCADFTRGTRFGVGWQCVREHSCVPERCADTSSIGNPNPAFTACCLVLVEPQLSACKKCLNKMRLQGKKWFAKNSEMKKFSSLSCCAAELPAHPGGAPAQPE